jgi:hypothetical protein
MDFVRRRGVTAIRYSAGREQPLRMPPVEPTEESSESEGDEN